ncbi:ferrous iron transport protein B [Acetitomaculum ruminis DSM 5522]|uniref:Ferrous iron transport protein B n=1 Tax=Acetitomaculum ruminis DSM 5522 TaxID=1120918 RepID=A0A1I0V1X9_9FIRM|nr:ferrous iron transport protein B [Acetitomaculum ruminis]SFA70047.1 ferrous iron transport protein B [Acetitomaculum ruminis DSM 5522]
MSIRIALIGNPNCGKTTMFNAFTGANQYVGNWPGVTVEKKEGKLKGDKDVIITDLPGIYSLSPYTLEEVVSRDYLVDEKPDAIINLVDATNLERNLYLTTQIAELGIPMVIALNLIDVSKKRGDVINIEKLGHAIGAKIVETSALKEEGLDKLVAEAVSLAKKGGSVTPAKVLDPVIEDAIKKVDKILPEDVVDRTMRRWYEIKLLERDSKIADKIKLTASVKNNIEDITKELEKDFDNDVESIITNARYDYIVDVIKGTFKRAGDKTTLSDKIDSIVTNRVLGIPIFAGIMFIVYYIAVSSIGTIVTDWTNDTLFGEIIQPGVEGWLNGLGANENIVDLVVNGIIGGVGSVLGFVPQMAILFLLLSILEDIGYMARVAFIMDRIFRHFGLSGKSFIPLLVSSGCGVPGIMSTKTIENDNDRRLTIITATYVPCGAKLPVIALFAGVIGAKAGAWWLAPLMYFIGVLAVLITAIILKKTKPFHGEAAPFVMELPQYHLPAPKTILMHVWERLWGYIKKVGTVLWIACMVMWFLSTYGIGDNGFGMVDTEQSFMAILGNLLAWMFIPLGFGNWQAVAATISGFVAKESIVSTMSILSMAGQDLIDDVETSKALWEGVRNTMFPTAGTAGLVAAFSFLTFNLLNSPCLAAISTLAKEMNSKKWTFGALVIQNINAYLITLMIYQFTMLILCGSFGIGTIAAGIVLVGYLYGIFRPDPYKNMVRATKRSVA